MLEITGVLYMKSVSLQSENQGDLEIYRLYLRISQEL